MMKKQFNDIKPILFTVASVWLISLCLFSCKKDSFINSSAAQFSTSIDTLKFDTVFTSIGSVTQTFKINNPNSQKLLLKDITLMGGVNSAFKININGNPVSAINDVTVAANDSIYVFVTVQINPSTVNLPFVVQDSIRISYNGNTRFVQLQAFGQNANFLRNRTLTGNVVFTNTLPYVILGSLKVDTNASLTIQKGTKMYLHANAPFIVDGTLIADGTNAEPIVFSGDRLDPDYRDLPASWPGIYFRGSSKNNLMRFAAIKNAYQAIAVEQPSPNTNPKLRLEQCTIDNAYDAGILAVNSSIEASNCLISNSGNNITVAFGGDYLFNHCTVVGYSSFVSHRNPVLNVNNYALLGNNLVTNNLNASFKNCIFWGEGNGAVENEIMVDKKGNNSFTALFDHCLYKATSDPIAATFNACIKNQDPQFDSLNYNRRIFDFHISNAALAPGNEKAAPSSINIDLDNRPRPIGLPDIGCYEKQ
jgi:hypothetical protein